MTNFTPTPAQRRKYADYTVEFREAENLHVYATVQDGRVYRWTNLIRRVPSDKTFIVYLLIGVTPHERRAAVACGNKLSAGYWAQWPDLWTRRKAKNGQIFYRQLQGMPAPDPFAQLELELMIDATSDVHQDSH